MPLDSWPTVGVLPDEAAALHIESVSSMAKCLLDRSWHEYEALIDDYEIDSRLSDLFSQKSDSPQDTVFSFYRDLFHLDLDPYSTDEVLVSHSFDDEDGAQNYQTYTASDLWQVEAMLSALKRTRSLVFPGTFMSAPSGSGRYLNARLERQDTWNALVIDMDPRVEDTPLSKPPIDPRVLPQFLTRIPRQLHPTHICLSGNGFHLYYVFDEPIRTGSITNPRRRTYKAFIKRFVDFLKDKMADLPVNPDEGCEQINHGYRAPGSLTKYDDLVRVFVSPTRKSCDPVRLSSMLSLYDDADDFDEGTLTSDDVEWMDAEDFDQWKKDRLNDPATDAQMNYLFSLAGQGYVEGGFDYIESKAFTVGTAGVEIRHALEKRGPIKHGGRAFENTGEWDVPAHPLVAGDTGGVYQKIYERITEVKRDRYMALFMLAGVAYSMVSPKKSLKDLEDDFEALLDTSWAKSGDPLKRSEIKKALKGYCAANYRTRASIERALGFSPFGPTQKRNYRSRDEHLTSYLPPIRAEKVTTRSRALLERVITQNPGISKAEAGRRTGLSKPTVSKYWDEIHAQAGLDSTTRAQKIVANMADVLEASPAATKAEVARVTGLSKPTVSKYWDQAQKLAKGTE